MRDEPAQAEAVRTRLREAAQHLTRAGDLLHRPNPAYVAGLAASVQAIRQAVIAFVAWHSLREDDGASLPVLARRAVPLASILETPLRRALPLEPLLAALPDKDANTVYEREGARTGYYTARNVFTTVLGELPACVHPALGTDLRPHSGGAPERPASEPERERPEQAIAAPDARR